MERIGEQEGRTLFGRDPAAYDAARPPYPEATFSLMRDLGVLFPGAGTLEIGAGSGIATRRLLELGAGPLVALEPDARFQQLLARLEAEHGRELSVLPRAFEDVDLAAGSFDLVVAATAFHWLHPATRVARIAKVLKTGGSAVLLWNLFQDLNKPDQFHLATRAILADLAASPSGAPERLPFALDRRAREREFLAGQHFESLAYLEIRWPLVLSTTRLRALYGGFSAVARLAPDRQEALLDELVDVADRRFGGRVTRNMTSVAYIFRRL